MTSYDVIPGELGKYPDEYRIGFLDVILKFGCRLGLSPIGNSKFVMTKYQTSYRSTLPERCEILLRHLARHNISIDRL